jgi:hypothetical protein
MTHTRLWVLATIIACIILVGFIISVPHTRDIPGEKRVEEVTSTTPSVSIRDVYRKGTHTLTGTVLAPNPCTTLTASAAVSGATGSQSIILTISMPKDAGICIQQETSLTFSTTVAADPDLPIIATLNGVPATVNSL